MRIGSRRTTKNWLCKASLGRFVNHCPQQTSPPRSRRPISALPAQASLARFPPPFARLGEFRVLLAFGEVMARIAPPGRLRWRQSLPGAVEVTWGGGEANVCASLALLGAASRYLATALPAHPLSDSLIATLRGLGVDCSQILPAKRGPLGALFVERAPTPWCEHSAVRWRWQCGEFGGAGIIRFRCGSGRSEMRASHWHHARHQRGRLPGESGLGRKRGRAAVARFSA